ncbi:LpqB family beta-propeller domain-containing protein [Actinomadura rugatobispora]|uniref:LpqB family beta-propeller domain-containing protein n=1 Tax=Actinomadura rugatobispora TaxID=1994 RepID=A0ABW1AEK8_9ACTN|nr:LpqB family beta-propeller domain-containing protein [Actinomadura rugatobispora]
MIRTFRHVVALAAVASLLAGCAGVPSGGRVVSGKRAEGADQVDDPYVRLIPVRPRPEWGPRQIVSGFLAASASFDDDHAVARAYMSGPGLWRPDDRPAVTVLQDRQDPDIVKETATGATVRVRGQQLGTIDPGGQYTADPKTVEVTFQVGRTAHGLWRITGLPAEVENGLLLTKGDVDRSFRTVNLFFFAPDQRTLVPNGIFLPLVNRRDLAAHLVGALLNGPTSWLDPAVESAFPRGSRLRGRGVTVSKDVATVDLTGEARGGNVERMSAQLSWTFRQLSEIKQWRLQIEGETVAPEGASGTQSVRSWQVNDPDGTAADQTAYVIGAAGHLSQLLQDQPQPVATGTGGRLVRPAVAPDYVEVAGLSPRGDQVLVGDLVAGAANIRTLLRPSGAGSRFTPPSWDRHGRLWTVESSGDKSWLWVRERRGQAPARVAHWGLGGRQVLAFRVSRDGVRAAAIVHVDGRAQVQIGRIVHEGGTDVGSFLPVSSELGGAIDLAWRDYGTLAVLGRKNLDSQVLAYLVPVSGGAISTLGGGALGMPLSIAAAPDEPVLIGTRSSHVKQVCRQRTPREQFSEWVCNIPAADPTYPR